MCKIHTILFAFLIHLGGTQTSVDALEAKNSELMRIINENKQNMKENLNNFETEKRNWTTQNGNIQKELEEANGIYTVFSSIETISQ